MSTLTLRAGLPAPSIAHNGERPLSHLVERQVIRRIRDLARQGIGAPVKPTLDDTFRADTKRLLLKAEQMTWVLLKDYFPVECFCGVYGCEPYTWSTGKMANKAHRSIMLESNDLADNYRVTFDWLRAVIERERNK